MRSTDFRVSFAASVTPFLWVRVVEKRRGTCLVTVTDCLRIGCVLVRKDMLMVGKEVLVADWYEGFSV